MDTLFDSYQVQNLNDRPRGFRSLGFLISSGIVHVVLLSIAVIVGALMPKPQLPDLTEITIIEPASSPSAMQMPPPPSAQQLEKQAQTAPAKALAKSEAPDAGQVILPAQKAAHASHTTEAAAKAMPVEKAQASKFQGPTVAESEVTAPVLETDDIEKSLKTEITPETKSLEDKDIADDLDKVDQENSAKVAALKSEMDSETNGALADQDSDLKAAKIQTDQEATALAKKAAALKHADQARIQQAQADEKIAAQKAAADQAAADRAAAALAAQQEAQAQANAARAAAAGRAQAAARDKLARETALGNQLGVNGPVHGLEDLRQVPGNHRPAYDSDDRMSGRQGDVAFLAYVGRDGKVTQFKLLKSSGHRSLDAKTFAAVRDWKFYPGQEGWVEIPFRWDLKGGPQEMTSTLRRSSSVSQK